jgi:hypothetical protein
MHAHSRPERDRQQVVSQESPCPIDGDRYHCERGCHREELEGSSGTEGAKLRAARRAEAQRLPGPRSSVFEPGRSRHAEKRPKEQQKGRNRSCA